MRLCRFQIPIAWLCVAGMWLANSTFARGLVVCSDGHGAARIELGCGQGSEGECLESSANHPEGEPAHPCEDTPLGGSADQHLTKGTARDQSASPIHAPPIPAAATPPWRAVLLERCRVLRAALERPPDGLRLIRTVVLRL